MVASLVPCLVCGDMGLCPACQATLPPPAEGLHLERARGAAVSVLVCTRGHRTEVSTAATRSNPPRACPACFREDSAAHLALLKEPGPDPELDTALDALRTRLAAILGGRGR